MLILLPEQLKAHPAASEGRTLMLLLLCPLPRRAVPCRAVLCCAVSPPVLYHSPYSVKAQ
jgi:hypothetical protein